MKKLILTFLLLTLTASPLYAEIYLEGDLLKECLELREILHNKMLADESYNIAASTDKPTVDAFLDKVYSKFGLKKEEHILDMKCGIIWNRKTDQEKMKKHHEEKHRE